MLTEQFIKIRYKKIVGLSLIMHICIYFTISYFIGDVYLVDHFNKWYDLHFSFSSFLIESFKMVAKLLLNLC